MSNITATYWNSTLSGDGFYVSYNNYSGDVSFYKSDTTALVRTGSDGVGNLFLLLDGDFRKEYARLKEDGFSACVEFFYSNIEKVNFTSVQDAKIFKAYGVSALDYYTANK